MRGGKLVKIVPGLLLLLVVMSLASLLFLNASRTDTVIDVSFLLTAGEKYGPYENGTYHHTRVASKSSLTGEITVQGGEIGFTADGFNTQHLKDFFINQTTVHFVIDPADDRYMFTFDNSGSSVASSVKFTLKETGTDTLSLMIAFTILLATVPIAILLIILGLRKGYLRKS
jgi:hypothetical protein